MYSIGVFALIATKKSPRLPTLGTKGSLGAETMFLPPI